MKLITQTHVVSIHVAVGQHHRWVVLIHDFAGDFAHQSRVCTVGHGERLSQFVKRFAADGAVWVFGSTIFFITLPEILVLRSINE